MLYCNIFKTHPCGCGGGGCGGGEAGGGGETGGGGGGEPGGGGVGGCLVVQQDPIQVGCLYFSLDVLKGEHLMWIHCWHLKH